LFRWFQSNEGEPHGFSCGECQYTQLMTDSRSEAPGRNSKVARIIEKYGLDGFGIELEQRWSGEGGDRMSLRGLADLTNQRLLRAVLIGAGVTSTNRDVVHLYETLNGDVSAGERVQKEREMERDGIDVADLKSDFVSHQAIHTYLTEYRNVEYESSQTDLIATSTGTLQKLRNRTVLVTENTISQLARNGQIALDDFDVFSEIRVRCGKCDREYDAVELINEGGCICR